MAHGCEVAILLSTLNGRDYLPEQLDSLLAQTHADWQIFWRDDGSDDGTPAIMRDFAGTTGAGRVIDLNDNAGHVGITASYLSLLRRAPRDRLVAFADQDDVWLPHKLARGVEALRGMAGQQPGLYCARQHVVDAQLAPIRLSAAITGSVAFPHAMTQNVATGCTVMLNPQAVALVAGARAPDHTLHDWWSYLLVTAAGGRVMADNTPTVLYRQHTRNTVGVPLSPTLRAWAALRRGPHVFMRSFRTHLALLEGQPDLLSPESRDAVALISSSLNGGWSHRLRALAHPGLRRQSWAETQVFRLWFMLG